MDGRSQTIVVDGQAYSVCFRGFHEPMEVYGSDGNTFTFLPWTYREHMNALRLSLVSSIRGLDLLADEFCSQVLHRSGLTLENAADLGGLALWWASGGGAKFPGSNVDDRLDLGPVRVRLKGWSNAERIYALSHNLMNDEAGEAFDVVGYLDAMVRASIETMDPLMDLDELDPVATATLIEAVLNLNAPEKLLPKIPFEEDSETARRYARTTLKLCASLGWTPARVWATPAAEVDRLVALIDLLQPAPVAQPSRSSGLADYPDAVVIHFEED